MSTAIARVALLLAAMIPGAPVAAQARAVIEMPAGGAVFGQAFELTVVRAWPRDREPQPFDPATLLPLELREIDAAMAVSGAELIERRRFEAVVHAVGEVRLLPYVLRTRDANGQEHADAFEVAPLTVRSSLPQPPGDVEWSGDVREARRAAIWPLLVGGVVLLAVLGFVALRRTRPIAVADQGAAAPSPAELARAEIAALALPGADRARLETYYLALAEIVRRFAMRQFGVRAFVHTSEELIAVVAVGGDPLRHCLFACDLVKFAAHRPATAGDIAARARALAFVAAAAAEADR